MRGRIILLVISAVLVVAATASASVPLVTPPCPQVEGWNSAGTFGPVDQGLGILFDCNYARPGQAEQLTLDVVWIKPSARDVDVDYSQCGKASYGGSYYQFIYSGTALVRVEYLVTGGPNNAGVFQADQARIAVAAIALLKATGTLAKPCTKTTAPPPTNTARPTVRVQPAVGSAGTVISFNFTVAAREGKAGIVLTIYGGTNNATVLLRKDYGRRSVSASGRALHAGIRANNRGAYLWCVTATNAAGHAATACSSLVVH
jgi:hypothetical protein